MKIIPLVLVTVFLVSTTEVHGLEFEKSNLKITKRDLEKWYWGHAPDLGPRNQNEKLQSTSTPPSDPCAPYEPIKPDFNAPGRKISEAKCSEYNWKVKQSVELDKRHTECKEIKKKKTEKKHNTQYFVIGGRPAKIGEFPHMGAIGWKAVGHGYIFKCGSSLISSKFVLTAAHCSKASTLDTTLADPVPKIIRINSIYIDDITFMTDYQYDDVDILRIINHPQYKSPKKYYDIALIELAREVNFSEYRRPACLWSHMDLSGFNSRATLTGWGVLKSGTLAISPTLQAAEVDIIDTQICDNLLRRSCNRNWCGVMDHQICAGKLAGGVDACQGDSGGPIQVKEDNITYVIGVTSFGVGCALPNLPGLYTRVASVIDWIEDIVWH